MKNILVRNIPDPIYHLLFKKGRSTGKSLNKIINELISKNLDLEENNLTKNRNTDFEEFFGSWSNVEHKNFKNSLKAHSKIDKTLWK